MFPAGIGQPKEKGVVCRYRDAVILYNPKNWEWLYEKFLMDAQQYIEFYRGDADVLGEWVPNQPTFPSSWLLKMHKIEKIRKYLSSPPAETIIVTGQPRSGLFMETHKIPWLEKMARL
jgi:hypothetical protein